MRVSPTTLPRGSMDGKTLLSSCTSSPSRRFSSASPSKSRRLASNHQRCTIHGGSIVGACGMVCIATLCLVFYMSARSDDTSSYPHQSPVVDSLVGQNDELIRSIAIIGERNSGTSWTFEHLGECFNHSVPVHRRLTRYKHWFQHHNASAIRRNTLVIAQFRNVYEWTEAMRRVPHHAANHIGMDWKSFVTKSWTMDRVGLDLEVSNETEAMCQEHFSYNEVISCHKKPHLPGYWDNRTIRYSEHQPLYEMRPDGTPYDNILQMRAAKIRNFLNTSTFRGVSSVWVVRYEDLLRRGTSWLVELVEQATGVKAKCKSFPPQKRRQRVIERGLIKWLIDNVDWDAERQIGYRT